MEDDIDHDDVGRSGDRSEEDRAAQVRSALLKALGVIVAVAVVIALGTTLVVHALGLNDNDSTGPAGAGATAPDPVLPTTALPAPSSGTSEEPEPSTDASPSASSSASPGSSASPVSTGKIRLDISPVQVQPNERVNLTGRYRGADNVGLEVQRFQNGTWQDFGVGVTVRLGTYSTYIQTGRPGEQRFRVYDPAADQSSNVGLVTIG